MFVDRRLAGPERRCLGAMFLAGENEVLTWTLRGETLMRLPVYVITYGCRKCGTVYTGEWDPNRAGHVEPATACPSCGSPVRLHLGTGQKSEGTVRILDAVGRPRIPAPTAVAAAAARQGAV